MLLLEIVIPIVTALGLCGLGAFVFRLFTPAEEEPALWLVFCMALVTLAAYLGMIAYLWVRAEAEGDTTGLLYIAFYCLIFWTVPVGFYSRAIMQTLEAHALMRPSWLAMKIPDEGIYPKSKGIEAARELATLGDIDGAVKQYRATPSRRIYALFSAAKLLEAEGEFDESVELYEEISTQSEGTPDAWAEAMFRLAKLHEQHLDDLPKAVSLLNGLVTMAPDTEYGAIAFKHLSQLHQSNPELVDSVRREDSEPVSDRSDVGAGEDAANYTPENDPGPSQSLPENAT